MVQFVGGNTGRHYCDESSTRPRQHTWLEKLVDREIDVVGGQLWAPVELWLERVAVFRVNQLLRTLVNDVRLYTRTHHRDRLNSVYVTCNTSRIFLQMGTADIVEKMSSSSSRIFVCTVFDFVCIAYCLLSTMFAWWIKILFVY